jgi:hypothetical protein
MKVRLFAVVIVLLLTNACSSSPAVLAAFEENSVKVTITLERSAQGDVFLAGTFTPTEAGYHLYSKDLPIEGVNGLGGPTLLALTATSSMQASGELQANLAPLAEPLRADLPELRVYPAGTVILRLPVNLPAGQTIWQDEVAVTYMVCKGSTCKRPVVGKIIPVQITIEP